MERNIYGTLLPAPSVDFSAVQQGRISAPDFINLDLSVARSVAAGTAQEIIVAGNFFFSDMNPTLQGGFTVHFQDTSQKNNPKAGLYAPPGFLAKIPFTRFLIENAAQPGMRALIAYGTDVDINPGGSAQVSVTGSVNVVDGGKARTLANNSFQMALNCAQAVGFTSRVMLWNPAASGVNLILKAVRIAVANASDYVFGGFFAANTGFVDEGTLLSKLAGGSGSASHWYIKNDDAAQPFAAVSTRSEQLGATLNLSDVFALQEPIVIPPNNGYGWHPATTNNGITVVVEVNEIAVGQ